MRAQDIYSDIIQPVFEEKLFNYFEYMLERDVNIVFLPFANKCYVAFDKGFNKGYYEFLTFYFLNNDLNICFDYETPKVLRCIANIIPSSFLKDSSKILPYRFIEGNEFLFTLREYELENIDITKKVFLKEVIHSFGLTVDYLKYEKKKEDIKFNKLIGDVVF